MLVTLLRRLRMSEPKLAWGIAWRMVAWGLGGGALFGCGYGALLEPMAGIGLWIGMVLGGLMGIVAGLLDALALVTLTHYTLLSPANRRHYRTTACLVSIMISGLITFLGSFWLTLPQGISSPTAWTFFGLVPAVIAM